MTGVLFFVSCSGWDRRIRGAVKFCLLGALLVGLTFSDLEARILPDEFTLGGTAAGLILAWFVPFEKPDTAMAMLSIAGVHGNPDGIRWARRRLARCCRRCSSGWADGCI